MDAIDQEELLERAKEHYLELMEGWPGAACETLAREFLANAAAYEQARVDAEID